MLYRRGWKKKKIPGSFCRCPRNRHTSHCRDSVSLHPKSMHKHLRLGADGSRRANGSGRANKSRRVCERGTAVVACPAKTVCRAGFFVLFATAVATFAQCRLTPIARAKWGRWWGRWATGTATATTARKQKHNETHREAQQ